jgi:hypothetical protein
MLREENLGLQKGECLDGNDADRRLTNMAGHTFTVEGRKDHRLRFPLENGRVERCEVLWFDDTSDTYIRADRHGQGPPSVRSGG